MRAKNVRLTALALSILFVFSAFAGCTSKTPAETPPANTGTPAAQDPAPAPEPAPANEPVVVKFPTFQIGVNSFAPVLEKAVADFNTQNEGKIKLEVEEIPGDQAYNDKMKVLLSADQLPDIIYTGGYNLLDLALEKNAVMDLTPYFDADPEWKAMFSDIAIRNNSRDGKIYGAPMQADLIGYFYNKELFDQAGVSVPKTWDEFFDVCAKLKEAGITPMSMDTADSGWVTSLWLMAMVGTNGAQGNAFANQSNPTDYNTPEFIDAVGKIQTLFQQYTTSDAAGGNYDVAANAFCSGETAMIANGPWMIADFSNPDMAPEGFDAKLGAACFPGGGIIDDVPIGYLIGAKEKETQDAAVEFVKYMTGPEVGSMALEMIGQISANTKVAVDDEIKAKYPLLAELVSAANGAEYRFSYHQALWYPNTVDVISTIYPPLALGQMTPEAFASALTEAAAKN